VLGVGFAVFSKELDVVFLKLIMIPERSEKPAAG
jgi:hypothetical protein